MYATIVHYPRLPPPRSGGSVIGNGFYYRIDAAQSLAPAKNRFDASLREVHGERGRGMCSKVHRSESGDESPHSKAKGSLFQVPPFSDLGYILAIQDE